MVISKETLDVIDRIEDKFIKIKDNKMVNDFLCELNNLKEQYSNKFMKSKKSEKSI